MPTPVLKLRKDIWTYFPVNVDPMGRGENGAERHCVEWHNGKLRQIAKDEGKSVEDVKAALLPQLLHALSKSIAWTVEAPPPGSRCVAILAMRFAAPKNQTRKANNVGNWRTRRVSPKPSPKPSPNKNKTAKVSANKKKANNTRKVKNHSDLAGEALLRKARAILNKLAESNVDALSKEFATLTPKSVGESEELLKIVVDIALDQQAYHPLLIHLLHVLDAQHGVRPYHEKPSVFVGERMFARAMEEPLFAKVEVSAEEKNSPVKNLDDQVRLQKRFFRSVMLFTGFLYRDGFLPWTSYKRLLTHFASYALELDPAELDYRIYDGYAQGLMYTLIRGGARMVAEGGEAAAMFQALLGGIGRLAAEAKRGFVRTDAQEFLDSAANGFKIKAGMTWTVGAPLTDIKKKSPKAVAAAPVVGLGADISELWRRFPLDVKQEGDLYVVRFHNKKLRERYEKETKYRSVGDLEAAMSKQILGLIDGSAHWKRGPSIAGTLVTVLRK